jgi:Leucine-rich repeat (LRR) protein
MSRKLIKELIMSRLGSDKLDSIKTLNLWGNNIDDISLLSEMPSLEILSLSTNHIQDLRPLKNLKNLKELYLQDNNISDINQIEFLKNCKQLEILNLSENPITKFQNYRQKVLNILPFLKRLDDIENTNIFQHNKFSFHQNPLMFFKKIFPKRVNKQNNINDLNNSINLDEINNQRNTVNNRNDILNKSFKKKKYIGTFKIGNKKSETNNMNISFDSDPNKYNKKIIKKIFKNLTNL